MNNILIAKEKLRTHGIDESLAEYLYRYLDDRKKFDESIEKLILGMPIQYIIGNVNFHGLKFNVNKNVLIPRFETEELVEKTINYINKLFNDKVNILDIGTGSGCIAITLYKKINNSNVTASDISLDAIKVAKENAKLNDCNVTFINSNLLDNINDKYDVIISNPPYISNNEEIMDIVRNNEPHLALYADKEGYYCYENILKNANRNLNSKNLIAFEIGETQGLKIKEIAKMYFPNSEVIIDKDLQGRDRFIFIINI